MHIINNTDTLLSISKGERYYEVSFKISIIFRRALFKKNIFFFKITP